MIAAGQLFLLRAEALESTLKSLSKEPMNHDGRRVGLSAPHWIKICRASGGVDTGLRVIYLLGVDGSVRIDDLYLEQD